MKKLIVVLLLCGAAFAQQRHGVVLTWSASTTAGVDHYKVYRSLTSGSGYSLMGIVPASQTTFTNGSNPDGTPLISGQTYCYVTTALQGQEESTASNEFCATIPTPPASPSNLSGTVF